MEKVDKNEDGEVLIQEDIIQKKGVGVPTVNEVEEEGSEIVLEKAKIVFEEDKS